MAEQEYTFTATVVVAAIEGESPEDALDDYLACNDVSTAFELVPEGGA